MWLLLSFILLQLVSFLSSDQLVCFFKNSLKFDDSNNGDSTDDREDEECEPKSAVSKKT